MGPRGALKPPFQWFLQKKLLAHQGAKENMLSRGSEISRASPAGGCCTLVCVSLQLEMALGTEELSPATATPSTLRQSQQLIAFIPLDIKALKYQGSLGNFLSKSPHSYKKR